MLEAPQARDKCRFYWPCLRPAFIMAQVMSPTEFRREQNVGSARRIGWGSPRSRSAGLPREDNSIGSHLYFATFIIFIRIPVCHTISVAKGPIRIIISSPRIADQGAGVS